MPLGGGFSRGSPISPTPSFRRRSIFTSITLIGSQDLAVKSHPNLFTSFDRQYSSEHITLASNVSSWAILGSRGAAGACPGWRTVCNTYSASYKICAFCCDFDCRQRRTTLCGWSSTGMKERGKREIPEKTNRPATSSGTIPTCENPGVARPGIEPGLPGWEASRLTARPPRTQSAHPYSDWLREVLGTSLVSHWLLQIAKGSLLAGLPPGECVIADADWRKSSLHLAQWGPAPTAQGVGWPTCSRGAADPRPGPSAADSQIACRTGNLSASRFIELVNLNSQYNTVTRSLLRIPRQQVEVMDNSYMIATAASRRIVLNEQASARPVTAYPLQKASRHNNSLCGTVAPSRGKAPRAGSQICNVRHSERPIIKDAAAHADKLIAARASLNLRSSYFSIYHNVLDATYLKYKYHVWDSEEWAIKSQEFGVSCDLMRQLGDSGAARDGCSDMGECVGELAYSENLYHHKPPGWDVGTFLCSSARRQVPSELIIPGLYPASNFDLRRSPSPFLPLSKRRCPGSGAFLNYRGTAKLLLSGGGTPSPPPPSRGAAADAQAANDGIKRHQRSWWLPLQLRWQPMATAVLSNKQVWN
ncbi:hypothetical protein PR048_009255 [Dryococelus australis]|uniref:Uncharacterized protein n=1 Tax=Dryococelus australis TaxID=614101 RepID=A0ABQ9HZC2_9NEOP|nr:hypothetical protein PR048_009255 [Dryococelus australis]